MLTGCFISEAQLNGTVELRQAAITHFFFAQQAFDVALVHFHACIDSFVHVHFQQEVHTARQVQTQFHRVSTQTAQPLWRGLCQVERYDIVVAQGLAYYILGWQLVVFLDQAQQTTFAVLGQGSTLDFNACIRQRLACAIQISLSDLQGRARTRHLNGRIIRVQIGSGINKTDRQHRQDQYVFPQRVFVQHQSRRPLKTRGALRAPSIVES